MALNFDNHLLETPDGLLTTFFWHLALEVVLGAFTVLSCPVLVLLRDILPKALLQVIGTNNGASVSTLGLSNLSALLSGPLSLLLAEEFVLIVLLLILRLQALHVGNIVPGVVSSRLIDLGKLLLSGVDPRGSPGSGIASNVPENNRGIVDWRPC